MWPLARGLNREKGRKWFAYGVDNTSDEDWSDLILVFLIFENESVECV